MAQSTIFQKQISASVFLTHCDIVDLIPCKIWPVRQGRIPNDDAHFKDLHGIAQIHSPPAWIIF